MRLADGDTADIDKLLIATGATPRRLPVAGADADGVHYLRSLDDCETLRATLAFISNLVVIGAGWIGLEVTAAARHAGVHVTVVETAELPMLRVLGPEIAEVFASVHREHGVDLRCKTLTSAIRITGARVTGVELHDGSVLAADAVVVAVGVEPNTQLAAEAALKIDNGVVVNASLRTEDEDIFAAGDVANAWHPLLGRYIRGTAARCSWVLAGMNVNVWDVTDPIKALINSRVPVNIAKLTDASWPLEELAAH